MSISVSRGFTTYEIPSSTGENKRSPTSLKSSSVRSKRKSRSPVRSPVSPSSYEGENFSYFEEMKPQNVVEKDDISIPQSEDLHKFDESIDDVAILSARSLAAHRKFGPKIITTDPDNKPIKQEMGSPLTARSDGSDVDWLLEHADEMVDVNLLEINSYEKEITSSTTPTGPSQSQSPVNHRISSQNSSPIRTVDINHTKPSNDADELPTVALSWDAVKLPKFDLNLHRHSLESPYLSFAKATKVEKKRAEIRSSRVQPITGSIDMGPKTGTGTGLTKSRQQASTESLEALASDLFLFKPSSKHVDRSKDGNKDRTRRRSSSAKDLALGPVSGSQWGPQMPSGSKLSVTQTQAILYQTWAPTTTTILTVGPVSAVHSITMDDIHDIRAYRNISPQIWLITRAVYVMLFIYLEVMGDSAMSYSEPTKSHKHNTGQTGGVEGGGEEKDGGEEEGDVHVHMDTVEDVTNGRTRDATPPPVDMSNLWLTLRRQRDSLCLTPQNVLDLYSWPLLRSLMTMSRLLVIAMNRQIPTDALFRLNCPDYALPTVRKAVSGNLLKPEMQDRSQVGLKLCRWVRGVSALVWVERGGRYVKGADGADFHQVELQEGSQDDIGPGPDSQTGSTNGDHKRDISSPDSWISLKFDPPSPQSRDLPKDPVYTWHKVPYCVQRHARPKVFSCAIDGLSTSFAAYKLSTRLCREIDRLELIHVYSNSESVKSLIKRFGMTKDGVSEEFVDPESDSEVAHKTGSENIRMVFSADATPGTIKAMYEAEMVRELGPLSHRRVVCVARSAGRTVSEEISGRADGTGCDVLILGPDRIGAFPGPVSSIDTRPVTVGGTLEDGGPLLPVVPTTRARKSKTRSKRGSDGAVTVTTAGGVTAAGVTDVRNGDRYKFSVTDLRRLRCAVVISSSTVPLTLAIGPQDISGRVSEPSSSGPVTSGPPPSPVHSNSNPTVGKEIDSSTASSSSVSFWGVARNGHGRAPMKWVVAVGPALCCFDDEEGAVVSDSQAAVELALSLGLRGDSLLLVHISTPPPVVPTVGGVGGMDGAGSNGNGEGSRRIAREKALRVSQSYQSVYGMPVQVESLAGYRSVGERLCAIATALKPDFFVIGEGSPSVTPFMAMSPANTGSSNTFAIPSANGSDISGPLPSGLTNLSGPGVVGVTESLVAAASSQLLGPSSLVLAKRSALRHSALTAP